MYIVTICVVFNLVYSWTLIENVVAKEGFFFISVRNNIVQLGFVANNKYGGGTKVYKVHSLWVLTFSFFHHWCLLHITFLHSFLCICLFFLMIPNVIWFPIPILTICFIPPLPTLHAYFVPFSILLNFLGYFQWGTIEATLASLQPISTK